MPNMLNKRTVTRWYKYRILDEYCDGTITDTGLVNYISRTEELFEENRNWVRTPNFRQLVAEKKPLPDNPFSYQRMSMTDGDIVLQRTQLLPCTSPGVRRRRDIFDIISTLFFEQDEGSRVLDDTRVRAKLIERAKGAEWSAPVFFGEARQTVNMIANTARTIGSAFRDFRRGNFAGGMASLGIQGTSRQRQRYYRDFGLDPTRAAANHWLAVTYGWKPLVNDVYNAATTLAELSLDENSRVGSVYATTRRQDTQVVPDRVMMVSPNITARKTAVIRESCRGQWRFKPTSWNSYGSFGLLNPASVAWELVPFSFVVDWFLPIGRYLEGIDVPLRFDHQGGSIGYKRTVSCDYEDFKVIGLPASGSCATRFVVVTRDPLAGPPTLGLDSIVWNPNLGASRVTSAISLMAQIFRR